MTLAFLGHRPEEDVERVAAVLRGADAARGAPQLALGAGLLLPPRRARVLTVALADPDGALGALQARRQRRRWRRPGSTSPRRARSARTSRSRGCARARARPRSLDAAPEPLAFTAGAVTLYRSRLGRGGARLRAAVRAARLTHYSRPRMRRRSRQRRSPCSPRSPICAPAAAKLRWRGCPEAEGPRCTTVRVPLDRSGALAGHVDLHVARVAFARRRDSVLMYLSGGPGGAGVVEMIDVLFELPRADARLHGDRLRPARHRAQRAAALPGDRARRRGCARRPPAEQCARAARGRGARSTRRPTPSRTWRRSGAPSGAPKLTLFGISYGTELALAYARAHPDRVERLILDSVVDPDDERPVRARRLPRDGAVAARALPGRAAAASAPIPAPT